jgi:hypothetical protein
VLDNKRFDTDIKALDNARNMAKPIPFRWFLGQPNWVESIRWMFFSLIELSKLLTCFRRLSIHVLNCMVIFNPLAVRGHNKIGWSFRSLSGSTTRCAKICHHVDYDSSRKTSCWISDYTTRITGEIQPSQKEDLVYCCCGFARRGRSHHWEKFIDKSESR